jgi:L-lactate dehydrogenase complex protein LldG
MDSSRDQILKAIRRLNVPKVPLPELTGDWIQYDSAREQFQRVLESVGGELREVASRHELAVHVKDSLGYQSGPRRCTSLDLSDVWPGDWATDWSVQQDDFDDPHELATLDFALLRGEFAVAENAAVWVTDAGVRHRAVYFIAQHLAFVVPAHQVVHHLHAAYERLSFGENAFGCFVSGPSKTADIEQSLVIGAHGARSLVVYLLANE